MGRLGYVGLVLSLGLAGCAVPPRPGLIDNHPAAGIVSHSDAMTTGATGVMPDPNLAEPMPGKLAYGADIASPAFGLETSTLSAFRRHFTHPLAGRTLAADSASAIKLNPGEVILTFDDGPVAGRTEKILDILDRFGVKATFMMVGQMANYYPKTVRAVALEGETIGTHSFDHANLSKLTPEAALADIERGHAAVAKALAPINAVPSPFFRFPYLAHTPYLVRTLTADDLTVLSVQIDSGDYMHTPQKEMLTRLLARLDKEGKGIVLFHDIHPRTQIILPEFLQGLADRGYKVVHLVAKTPSGFDVPTLTAATDGTKFSARQSPQTAQ